MNQITQNQKRIAPFIVILIAVGVLVVGGSAVRFFLSIQKIATFSTDLITGNSPSYKDFSSCSEMSRYVIETKGFPKDLIHSCSSTQYHNIVGGPFQVAKVQYGAAQDCPAGCFYDYFIAAVKDDERTIIEIPSDNKNNLLTTAKLPNYDFQKRDFSCDSDLDDTTIMKFAKRNNVLGWEIAFTKASTCSWKEVKSTKVTHNNDFIHTGDEVARAWSGNMFVSLKDNEYQWDYDELVTTEISRKEIIFND